MLRPALVATVLGLGSALLGCAASSPSNEPDYEVVPDGERTPSSSTGAPDVPGDDETSSPSVDPPAGGGGGTPPAKPETYVAVDGAETSVESITIDELAPARTIVKIRIAGGNAPTGSEVLIALQQTTEGCVAGPKPTSQELLFFAGGYEKEYTSSDGKACGLTVTSYAAKAGDFARGTFHGIVRGLDGEEGKSHDLDVAFSVERK